MSKNGVGIADVDWQEVYRNFARAGSSAAEVYERFTGLRVDVNDYMDVKKLCQHLIGQGADRIRRIAERIRME